MTADVHSPPGCLRLLPKALLELPLGRLCLEGELTDRLADCGLLTVGDALAQPDDAFADDGALPTADCERLHQALDKALTDGLRQFAAADSDDWPTLRAQLLGPLAERSREMLAAILGLDGPPQSAMALRQQFGEDELDDHQHAIRNAIARHQSGLLQRLSDEIDREFATFDGVLLAGHSAETALVTRIADATDDAELGLRLLAFVLPDRCHLHRGVLHAMPPRRFRELLRVLPQTVPQHRLPMPIATIATQLHDRGIEVPTGTLLHVLRTELHVAIEFDEGQGEVAIPDPRKPAARVFEILVDSDAPMTIEDLLFAYRERFRFASQRRLERQMQGNSAFVRLGPDTWSLRRWHEQELADCTELADAVVRRVISSPSQKNVVDLAREEGCDERTAWLVLDRLQQDPRLRLLGRGQACAADRHQSSVMERLQRAFRRAAGAVVRGRFLSNQPESQRRLVARLLDHNRAFVQPEPDRIDTLTNYPFNQERMQRLNKLVLEHLQQRSGYAHVDALKEHIDQTDLGGNWLTPALLADVLRRNGPFDVLAPDIVALQSIGLPASLVRSARQALRAAGEARTIDDIVRAHPELAEFSDCLAELLVTDPLVQSPDGRYFLLV